MISGVAVMTSELAGMSFFIHAFDAMVEPLPIVTSPSIVAFA